MKLKQIFGIFQKFNWKYPAAIFLGFLFFNLAHTLTNVVVSAWFTKTPVQAILSLPKMTEEYLYPVLLLAILVVALKCIKIIRPIVFSIVSGTIAAVLLQTIHLLLYSNLSYLVLLRDFIGVTVLTLVWLTFSERKTNKIRALGNGLFLSVVASELFGYIHLFIETGAFPFLRFAGMAAFIWVLTKIFEAGIKFGYRIFSLKPIV